jgi:phosphoribosylamine--glycine ligase
MPPGVPVATMGIGKAGAKNGAVLAVKILALSNPDLAKKLIKFRQDMVLELEEKAKHINV